MGSCLARLACLKLCYANVTFGHPWTPFGSSFSALMGGSRFSATVAQVFQSRDITDLRSQITCLPCHVVWWKHMFYYLRTRLPIFDMPLARICRNWIICCAVRSSHPTVRGHVLAKGALRFTSFVNRICSAFKRYFLLSQYTLLRIHCCCVLVLQARTFNRWDDDFNNYFNNILEPANDHWLQLASDPTTWCALEEDFVKFNATTTTNSESGQQHNISSEDYSIVSRKQLFAIPTIDFDESTLIANSCYFVVFLSLHLFVQL